MVGTMKTMAATVGRAITGFARGYYDFLRDALVGRPIGEQGDSRLSPPRGERITSSLNANLGSHLQDWQEARLSERDRSRDLPKGY